MGHNIQKKVIAKNQSEKKEFDSLSKASEWVLNNIKTNLNSIKTIRLKLSDHIKTNDHKDLFGYLWSFGEEFKQETKNNSQSDYYLKENNDGSIEANFPAKLFKTKEEVLKHLKLNPEDYDVINDKYSQWTVKGQEFEKINESIKWKFLRKTQSFFAKQELEKIEPFKYKKVVNKGKHILNVFITDTHYTDVKTSDAIENIKYYIVDMIKEYKKVDKIFLNFLGDAIENKTHKQQIYSGHTNIVMSISKITNIYIEVIKYVIKSFPKAELEINMVSGNHDELRPNGSKSGELRDENIMYLIYDTLKRVFDKLKINYDERFLTYQVDKKNILLTHGHIGIKNSMDAPRWVQDRENQTREKFDYAFMGHFHKFSVYDRKGCDSKVVLVPSAKSKLDENSFEIDNNLRSTRGFLIVEFKDKHETIDFVATEY